ncbi:MAG: DNA alkylation repair protein [Candidatus Micrarchaeia archaeon]
MTANSTREIIRELRRHSSKRNREGMARFGINSTGTLGVSVPVLRQLAKRIGKDHALALELWKTKIHEARLLASMVDEPARVTRAQADAWARGFDSWDVCDQACMNLFDKTPFAYAKAREWAGNDKEFVKRAGFALMASLAVHDKAANDEKFEAFFPLIEREANDERNFVKKSVNWALRQIGKRNARLRVKAMACARRVQSQGSRAARWIASDALRELNDAEIKTRLP